MSIKKTTELEIGMATLVRKCAKKSYFFEKVDYLGGSRAGNLFLQTFTTKVLS
jgi:hypothetical protein